MISFEGKVALVVGGTSGIGRATAEGFGRLGASVVLAGRREDRGEQVARGIVEAGGEATFIRTDVREDKQAEALVQSTVERHGLARLRVQCCELGAHGRARRPPRHGLRRRREDELAGGVSVSQARAGRDG